MKEEDIIYGYDAIGRFLNMTAQQARNRLLASEAAPIFKVGRKIAARPGALSAWLSGLEAASIAARHSGNGDTGSAPQ